MIIACSAYTPLGIYTALYQNGIIHRVYFPDESLPAYPITFNDSLSFSKQISEFFKGKRKTFGLPIFISGTPFRQDVYRTTLTIPYGETATYADVAFTAGYPRAMRAIGSAMKANQLPILLPCHRVVHKTKNKDRGGTRMKQYLLNIEQKYKFRFWIPPSLNFT